MDDDWNDDDDDDDDDDASNGDSDDRGDDDGGDGDDEGGGDDDCILSLPNDIQSPIGSKRHPPLPECAIVDQGHHVVAHGVNRVLLVEIQPFLVHLARHEARHAKCVKDVTLCLC